MKAEFYRIHRDLVTSGRLTDAHSIFYILLKLKNEKIERVNERNIIIIKKILGLK